MVSMLLVSAKELRLDRDVCNRLKWKRAFNFNSIYKYALAQGVGWSTNYPFNFLTCALILWHMISILV